MNRIGKKDYSQGTGLARKITVKEQDWQERLQSMNRIGKKDYSQGTGLARKITVNEQD